MAQETSALWKELWRTENTEREYKFEIDGETYTAEQVVSHSVGGGLFEQFGIGNAHSATLTLELYADTVQKGATIRRYVRLVNGERQSEWIPKGVFHVNRRQVDGDYWTIEAYDTMRKAEVVWIPDQSLSFPASMPDAVAEFCRIMGVELDSRTALNASYSIDYPANDYTIRNELCFIAAAHAGNWIMTDAGKLLLVPLLSAPPSTNYLVTERGDPIVIGGVRILV